MNHVLALSPDKLDSTGRSPGGSGPARPASGTDAIERIARTCNVPKDVIQRDFWQAWDALVSDAKCLDYVLVLAEKRVMEAIRRKRRSVTSIE